MDDNTAPDVPTDTSLANNRSRRTRKDKTGRLAALERLKKAKQSGEKIKYEVADEADVYEEVDEETYSRIVRDRQEDDWIIDDDGSGYVEDGREIFDEDGGEVVTTRGKKGGAADRRKKNPNIRAHDSKPKSIRSMFAAAAVKAKPSTEKDVKLNEDDVLGDIMAELHQEGAATAVPAPVKLKKKTPARPAYNPFSAKGTPKKPAPKLLTPRNMNDELTPPPKKSRRPAPPSKTSLKTALDDLDDEPQIEKPIKEEIPDENVDMSALEEDFADDMEDDTSKVAANEVKKEQKDPNESVDLGDIDFDDDMETEATTTKEKKTELLPQFKGWEGVTPCDSDIAVDVQVDSSQLPLTTNDDGEQVLRMYWLDAYEDRYKQPGVVYLFGKVWIESAKTHVSCCLSVRNIQRRIFILPRTKKMNLKTKTETDEDVTFVDVYKEFSERITEKYRITNFKSKKATKEYAFEKVDVPAESDYLEVHYPAEFPALPEDLSGETFSHVFGTPTSSLELLLTDRRMRGPCWLDIKKPQIPNPAVSWCKVEAFINSSTLLTLTSNPPTAPPYVLMTLNLLTMPNPKTHQNEVLGAAVLIQHKFHADKPAPKPQFQQHFCAITKPNDCVFPFDFREKVQKKGASMKVEVMGTERALLGFLLAKIHKLDPDFIVGHDVFGFDLEVLLSRIEQNKVPHWSRLGRLKRANIPKFSYRGKGAASNAAAGRLVADVMISAKELIRCRSYDLTELVNHVLHEKRDEIDLDLMKVYYSSSSTLLQLVERTLVDATFALRILYELMVVPLALSITNICGNIMSRTLLGGRSERNEYLLLHAFHERNFIVPDKTYTKKAPQTQAGDGDDEDGDQSTNKRTGRRKPAYEGGLVLEPKKGFYDKFILLLDFNSLYPSIIQEYNICFTTVTRTAIPHKADEEAASTELPDAGLEPGVLPTEIRKLVQSRRQVKQLMKAPDLSPDVYMQYDIRQKALKLTANSMYGCLGFSFSRFYAKPLAALVTSKGREILMKTKDLVETMNLEVIYGDTDSIMVNTNSTDLDVVFKLGHKVKGEVNKLYKLLEIDIDGVFKSMLLLKKKKYAAITVSKVGDKIVEAQELKGLDIVRRDWCTLAKEAGNYVVSQILSGDGRESIVENIHAKLMEVGQQVKEGTLPIDLYHITKSLTKNPEDYPDKKSLPHVQVALRLNSKGGRKLRAGDTVYYVICEDGSNLAASQRAYHPDELEKADNLKIDSKYYLAHQIHPVVSRLCDPIDGTDAAFIAECLGLDAAGYRFILMYSGVIVNADKTRIHSNLHMRLDAAGYRQALARGDQQEEEALLGGSAVSDEEKYRDADRLQLTCPDCDKQVIVDAVFNGAHDMLDLSLAACPGCKGHLCAEVPLLCNKLSLLMRSHIRKYYEGWLKCEDTACSYRSRKVPLLFTRGHPACPVCRKSRLQQEYTDLALYTQLSFYQYIFDFEKAVNSLAEPKEKERAKSIRRDRADSIAAYRQLKAHVERQVRQCAYSEVSLSRLFNGLFSLKA